MVVIAATNRKQDLDPALMRYIDEHAYESCMLVGCSLTCLMCLHSVGLIQ